MTYCLDAWAVLEWLEGGEPARTRVTEILRSERPLMNWINVGEVAYVLQRRVGGDTAREIVARLRGGLSLDEASPGRVLEAAAIKAEQTISYAAAFAIATASAHDAVLVTGDPEILAAEAGARTEDLRPPR